MDLIRRVVNLCRAEGSETMQGCRFTLETNAGSSRTGKKATSLNQRHRRAERSEGRRTHAPSSRRADVLLAAYVDQR